MQGLGSPQNRGQSKYERISWDEATDIIAGELKRVIKKYGPTAVLLQADGHGETKVVHAAHGCSRRLLSMMGGYTWQTRNPGTTENLLTVYSIGYEVWAGGFDGVILYSADGGRTWKPQSSHTTQSVEDIYFGDTKHGWAVGWSGLILRTADGGVTWQAVTNPASWTLNSVYFRDLQNGWASPRLSCRRSSRCGRGLLPSRRGPTRDRPRDPSGPSPGR